MLNTNNAMLQCPKLELRSINFNNYTIHETQPSLLGNVFNTAELDDIAKLQIINVATGSDTIDYYAGLDKQLKLQFYQSFHGNELLEVIIRVDENLAYKAQLNQVLLTAFKKFIDQKFAEQKNYQNIAALIKIVSNEENLFTIDSYLKVLAYHLPKVKGSDLETDKSLPILPIASDLFLTAVLAYFDAYPNLHVSAINVILKSFLYYIRQHAVLPKSPVLLTFVNKLLTGLDKDGFLIYDDILHVKDLLFLAKRSKQLQLNLPLSQAVEFAKLTNNKQDFHNPKVNFKLTDKNDLIRLIDNLADSYLIADLITKGFKSMFSNEKVYGDNILHINTNWSKDVTIDLNGLDAILKQEIASLSSLYLKTNITTFIKECLSMIAKKAQH